MWSDLECMSDMNLTNLDSCVFVPLTWHIQSSFKPHTYFRQSRQSEHWARPIFQGSGGVYYCGATIGYHGLPVAVVWTSSSGTSSVGLAQCSQACSTQMGMILDSTIFTLANRHSQQCRDTVDELETAKMFKAFQSYPVMVPVAVLDLKYPLVN